MNTIKVNGFEVVVLNKAKMIINGATKDISRQNLVNAGCKAQDIDRLLFDIYALAKRPIPTASHAVKKAVINPEWQIFNDCINEGGEGYNPHAKYI